MSDSQKQFAAAQARLEDEEALRLAQHRQDLMSSRIVTEGFKLENYSRLSCTESKPAKKVYWLRKLADMIVPAAEGLTACHTGCSHCCHIPVMLTELEARVIAHETGRHIHTPQTYRREGAAEFIGVACPFLTENRCSIYESRPFACRTKYNVDIDNLLCQLVPGKKIGATYLNTQRWDAAYGKAFGFTEKVADIRDYFPTSVNFRDAASSV